ncbi:MAG: substrate-binding domain-containing protein [Polaromonas sp.]
MILVHSVLFCSADWRRPVASVASLAMCCSFAIAASAAEVKVLTAEAFVPVVAAMTPVFQKRTGHKLVVVKDTSAAVAKRIRDGQDFDLVILPPAMLEALGKEDTVYAGSIIPLAKVAAGTQNATVYAGAVSTWASDSPPALSLLILLASEETQVILKDKGMTAP